MAKKTLSVEAPEETPETPVEEQSPIIVEANPVPLLADAATFPVTVTHEWGQLFDEVTQALAPTEVGMVAEDGDDGGVLHVSPADVDADVVNATIAAHVPVRHYGYTDDQKHLHNIALKIKLGESLTSDEQSDQFRALFALQNGTLASCDCTTPV